MGTAVRRRRWWLWSLAAVVLVALGAVAVTWVERRARYGDIHTGAAPVVVSVGQRFSLAVPDRGASVGDHWTATVAPDGVVSLVRSEQVPGNLVDRLIGPADGGGAGTRYFVFAARRPGSATVTLHNCFQGCGSGPGPDPGPADQRDAMWTVAVR